MFYNGHLDNFVRQVSGLAKSGVRRKALLVASIAALFGVNTAHAVDYSYGSVTENFTLNATDRGRGIGTGTVAGIGFNDNGLGSVYDRGADRDATYFHFDLSPLAGATINGTVNFNLLIDTTFGGAINGGIVGSATNVWNYPGTTPGITTISGADPSGSYSNGQTATAVIDNTTFQGFVTNRSTFFGLGITAGGGSTAHFGNPVTLTGNANVGMVTVADGTDWSAAVWDGISTLTISGASNVSGGSVTVRTNANLVFTGSSTLGGGTFAGNFFNNGTLSFGSSANQTLSGVISGTGSLTKSGTGTLTLTGHSTYNGGTTVNGGTLLLDGGSGGNARIRGDLTVNSGATVNFANDDGTGLGWNGANKVTSLTINGGTVSSSGTAHIWNFSGGVNMTGGTLQSNNGVSDANGPQLEWTNANVTTNASSDSAIIGGRIRMRAEGGSAITFNVADGTAADDLLVSAAITQASGGLGIIKNGAGTMKLTGANNYSGQTLINGGTLLVTTSTGLGVGGHNGGTMTFILDGATLALQGGISLDEHFHVWGSGIGGLGAVRSISGNNALTNAPGNAAGYALRSNTTVGVDAGTLTVTGFYEDSGSWGLTKVGAGTLVLTHPNTYTGDTTISVGTLEISGTTGTLGSGSVTNDGALVFSRSTNSTVSNLIVGSGSVTQSGTGTTTLSAANSYTGATTVTAGGLNLTGSLTSNVTVSGGGISGEGSTTGSLTFTGASTLTFDPVTSTFLSAASANATGATVTLFPTSSISGTGIVVLEALGGITGTAGGAGNNFVFLGRGTPYLNGPSGTATQLLFDFTPGSVVWKGNDGTNPTFWDVNTTTNWTLSGSPDKFFVGDSVTFDDTATSFNVVVQGASITPGGVTFNNTTAYSLSGGAIAGTTGLTKNGTGTVTIKSANTYTGATVINAGTLQLGDGTMGNDGSLTTSGITNDATLAYNLNGNQTVGYAISGTGALTKSGPGTLTLTAANTYGGGTTINGGILQAGNGSALGAAGSAISVAAGASLDINGQQLDGYTQNIQIAGAGADSALGALGNSGGANLNAIRGITLTANASIGGNAGRWDIGRLDFNVDPNNTVNHIDGGGFVLTKVGTGEVGILSGTSNLAGFILNAGRVTPHENTSFGAAPITINAGNFYTWGGLTQANNFTINGGTIGTDAGFNDNYTGSFAINSAVTFNTGNGNITLSGPVSGSGAISKTGGSRLILTGNNTQNGTLSISGGHVQFGSTVGNATQGNVELLNPGSFLLMNQPNQFGPNSGLHFNSPGHSEFALYGNDQTIASLSSANGLAVVQNSHGGFGAASANSTLTVNQSTDTTYSGVFRNNTGNDAFTLALVKSGTGKLTLNTNTEYTGGTTVNGGVLEITGSGGGNGRLRGTVTVNSGGELRYTGGDGTGFGYNGGNKIDTLNINGGLVDSQNVTHVWNATLNMTGGTLQSNNGVSDANGPQLEWTNTNVTTNASASSATIAGRIRMRPDGGVGISFNVADGSAASDLLVSAAITEASGGQSITKNGSGTMLLTGANNYTGNTTINGGTLKIAEGASIYNGGYNNSATLTVNNGATLELNRWGYGPGGANQSLGGLDYNPARFVINGGTVKYTGGAAGAPTDPGESPYGPGFTIGALGATLDAAKPSDTWTVKFDSRGGAPIASNDGGTLTLTGVGNGLLDKELGGTGGVVMNGSATWEMNRVNTYTGATTVSAGTLNISGSSAATSGVSVATGATLQLSGATNALSNTTNITNAGSLSVTGTAQSVGNISGAGSTTVSGAGSSATPTLIAKDIDQNALTINNGAYVRIAASGTSTSALTSLTMGTTANLDISDNDVVVNTPNPAAGTSTLSAVAARVNAGFAGGNGIVTNTFTTSLETVGFALNDFLGFTSFGGVTVNTDSVLIKYTYFGDSNLDGFVTDDDLGYFLAGYGTDVSSNPWAFGDYNHDGFTTDDDLGFFLAAYGSTPGLAGGGIQAIPEPSTFVLGTLAGLGLGALSLRRRRAKNA